MRNLKKVLSLTLALVMMLGMMTFAGAAETTKKVTTAADLTDMDKVVNKEAVSLLVDLKIVAGRETGAFDPAGTLTRAEFSKMIYVAKMGADDKAANFVGAATGLKDTKMWAEGYINYCFSTGIVAGRSATVFDPEGKLKTVEAAKMLLVALGYDAEAQGYIKDSLWSVNVMQDAKKNGLMDGIKDAADAFLSRDSAAQMIANALFAKTVTNERQKDFTGKWYISKTTQNATTLGEEVFGLVKIGGTVSAVADGKATINDPVTVNGKNCNVSGSGKAISGALIATPDTVGANVFVYVKGSINAAGNVITIDKIYSSALLADKGSILATNYGYKKQGTEALTALLVTADTKVATLEYGKVETATYGASILNVYYNGVAKPATTSGSAAEAARTAAVARIGKAGVITEFKDNGGLAGVDTVVITDKKVSKVLAPAVVSKDSKGNDVVTFTTLGLSKVAADTVVGYEGLVKGDYILSVTIGGITYIEKAASVEGVVTGLHSAKGILVGGTYYDQSALTGTDFVKSGFDDFKNTYTLFLDNAKNVVSAKKVTNVTDDKYAVLLDIAFVKGNGGIDGSDYTEAKLLFTDGTTKKVKIDTINGVKAVSTTATLDASTTNLYSTVNTTPNAKHTSDTTTVVAKTYYYTNPADTTVVAKYFGVSGNTDLVANSGLHVMTNTTTGSSTTAPTFATLKQFYAFTINDDGAYVLSAPAHSASLADEAIVSGKAVFNIGNAAALGNNETVFIYETLNGTAKKYTAYTGIANIPAVAKAALTSDGSNKAVVLNDAGYATYVFISTNAAASFGKTDMVFFPDATYTTMNDGATTYYLREAFINGKAGTIKVAVGDSTVTGMYKVTGVSDAGISTVTVADDTKAFGIKANVGNTLVAGDEAGTTFTGYIYDKDTVVYYLGLDGTSLEIAPENIAKDANDLVYAVVPAAGVADTIYVVEVAQTALAPTALATIAVEGTHTATKATYTNFDLLDSDTAADKVTVWGDAAKWIAFKMVVAPNTTATLSINGVNVPFVVNDTATAATDFDLTTASIATSAASTVVLRVAVTDSFNNTVEVFTYNIAFSGHA